MMFESYDLLLILVSAIAGGINAIAGGGTLLTFPILVGVLEARGLPTAHAMVLANGTSTVGLFVGPLAAVFGYRQDYQQIAPDFTRLFIPSILGGFIGAVLLMWVPAQVFSNLLPWLVLFAAMLFASQPMISRCIAQRGFQSIGAPTVIFLQFLVALYGGYFGAGIGILMLATLGFYGLKDIHAMNTLKSMLGFSINGIAVCVFIAQGNVEWTLGIEMMIASIIGGYFTARTALKFDPVYVRRFIAVLGVGLAAYYGVRLI